MSTMQPDALANSPTSEDTTSAVLDHHLGAFSQGLDEVLSDYTDKSCLITPDRIFRGTGDIRSFFQVFMDSATEEFWANFELGARVLDGEIAYITWCSRPAVTLATDTLLVRDGKILTQTFTAFSV